MTDLPPRQEPSNPRWPLILGGLVGGFLLLAVGLGLGWYLFYRPIVNVAVQLPAAPPAAPQQAPSSGQKI
jgi:serine protease Do